MQSVGIISLLLGSLMRIWQENFFDLIFIYTFAPLPAQISLCAAVAILASLIRKVLFIK